jgi:hypothetical protein
MFIGLSLSHLHGNQIHNFLSSLEEDQKMAGIKSTVSVGITASIFAQNESSRLLSLCSFYQALYRVTFMFTASVFKEIVI